MTETHGRSRSNLMPPKKDQPNNTKLYYFNGRDDLSDRGYFEIIVRSNEISEAINLAKSHLEEINRNDLLDEIEEPVVLNDTNDCIIHSTAKKESGHESV